MPVVKIDGKGGGVLHIQRIVALVYSEIDDTDFLLLIFLAYLGSLNKP